MVNLDFCHQIQNRILIHDGSKGYMLQKAGLKAGECSESWNLTHKDEVTEVYRQYADAGSDVIQSNTFPGNRIYLEKYGLGDRTYDINYEGVRLAREAAGINRFVTASVGPTGKLFEPVGELTFDRAYEVFKEQITAAADAGADAINFETFTDLLELKAAMLAAIDACRLPLICSMSFEGHGRTMNGTSPEILVHTVNSLGAFMAGTNCSAGPAMLLGIVKKMYETGGAYLSVKPNAGMPSVDSDGNVTYGDDSGLFAQISPEFASNGARLIGGCCGTTPEYIKAIRASVNTMKPAKLNAVKDKYILSRERSIAVRDIPFSKVCFIGPEHELFRSLEQKDDVAVAETAMDISHEGFDAVLLSSAKSRKHELLLPQLTAILQQYIRIPFIFETGDPDLLEGMLRSYAGIAGVCPDNYPIGIRNRISDICKRYGSPIISIGAISANMRQGE